MTEASARNTDSDVAYQRRPLRLTARRPSPRSSERWTALGMACCERDDYRGASRYFLKAARAGHAKAQYELGKLYVNGKGVLPNPGDAAYWYREATEQGHRDARFELSLMLLHGRHGRYENWYRIAYQQDEWATRANLETLFPNGLSVAQDFAESLRLALSEAESGRIAAQVNVGLQYLHGFGCEEDYREARRWLEEAAVSNSAEAQNGLAVIYAHGLGVNRDTAAASQWYDLAAAQGEPNAQFSLAMMYASGEQLERSPERAAALLEKSSDQGNVYALHHLGLYYLKGFGVPRDRRNAESCLRRAAHKQHVPAMLALADCYAGADGDERNLDDAALWYRAAAALGSIDAKYHLACLLSDTPGLIPRPGEVRDLLLTAAETEHAAARWRLAQLMLRKGQPEYDPVKALEWCSLAAGQHFSKAQTMLSKLYLEGEIVPRDMDIAKCWLLKAIEHGDPEASTLLALMLLDAEQKEPDHTRALALLQTAAEQEYSPAARHLAQCLARDFKTRETEVRYWFSVAAELGDGESQVILGQYYLDEANQTSDAASKLGSETLAASWFEKAAEQGIPEAQYQLGVLYAVGGSVIQEPELAFKFYLLAAEQGHSYAMHNLGNAYVQGDGVDEDPIQAVSWYRKAAGLGISSSHVALGDLYVAGWGVDRDLQAAEHWYQQAATAGNEEAAARLLKLSNEIRSPTNMLQPTHNQITLPLYKEDEPVRLVIWDLDDTFWEGTLSEGGITTYLQKNHDVVAGLSRRGIMNSICSKNDFDTAREVLQRYGVWDYFIFPSIDWTTKGRRVAAIVAATKLRSSTVLFIDDNPKNLAEVAAEVPGIRIADPGILHGIMDNPLFVGKDDAELSRLNQYKLLEKRTTDQLSAGGDDETFLRKSDIRIFIETDIVTHLDRAIELLNRTNKLNFTKRRLPEESDAARAQLLDDVSQYYVRVGLIRVVDIYGDYGYCGFYRSEDDSLLDYCFSCRILGMGVESWLYDRLGHPAIDVVGEVLTDLSQPRNIDWITLVTSDDTQSARIAKTIPEVRLRGGCDLDALAHYFRLVAGNVRSETNRDRDPIFVRMDSSVQLLPTLLGEQPGFSDAVERLGYIREDFTSSFLEPLDSGSILIYSGWSDIYQSIYRHKDSGFKIPLNLRIDDDLTKITDAELVEALKEIGTDEIKLAQLKSIQKIIREEYDYEYCLTVTETVSIMKKLFERIPEGGRLFLILPYEWYKDEDNVVHRSDAAEYNTAMKILARDYSSVVLIPMNDIVSGPSEIRDVFDHFDRIVYFRVYERIMRHLELS